MSHKLVVTTCPPSEASGFASALLERRLIACANLLPGGQSLYRWEGKIETASETVLLLKTREERVEELVETIRELHSYETPEVIVLPIEGGGADYLAWVSECTAG